VAVAEGESERFKQLVTQYEKAPRVTRERLYIEAVESVLGRSQKVVVDTKGNNQMIYLPLDKMMERRNNGEAEVSITAPRVGAAGEEAIPDPRARVER
jgi:membrane protease subunit HflK